MNKVIPHPVIGQVLYKKNKRSKRITLRIKEGGQVQVTLPYYATYQRATQFVEQQVPWIQQQLQKIQQKEQEKQLTWDSRFSIRNQVLLFAPSDNDRLRLQTTADTLTLLVPKTWDLQAPTYQTALKNGLLEVLRKFAKEYLPARTRYWAKYHGIPIANIRIKNVKSRWGSCSSKGNINLSLHLMLLPDALIDYVICHELAHIAHPNHSPAFWGHLEELLPGAQQLDQQLNHHRPS